MLSKHLVSYVVPWQELQFVCLTWVQLGDYKTTCTTVFCVAYRNCIGQNFALNEERVAIAMTVYQ